MKVSPLFRYHYTALLLAVPALFIGTGLFLWRMWPQMRLVMWELFNKPEATCGCDTIFAFSSHPTFYSLMFLTALASVALLVFFLFNIVKHVYRVRRLVAQLPISSEEVFSHNGRSYTVQTVHSDDSLIFTYGLFQPRIIVSSSAEEELDEDQLRSILLHEVGHIRRFDAVTKIVLFALVDTFFFVPGIQKLKQSVELSQELSADEYAIAHTGRHSVLSALAALIHNQQQHTPSVLPSFALVNERLHSLLLEDVSFPFKSVLASLALTFVLMLIPSVLFAESGALLDRFAPRDDASAVSCIQEYEAVLQSSSTMTHFSATQCDVILMRDSKEPVLELVLPPQSSEQFDIILINNYPR